MSGINMLRDGEVTEFKRLLTEAGYTAADIRKLNKFPQVLVDLHATMRAHPIFKLIHGRFTSLADKIEMVKSYPGVNPEDVDAAVTMARENGLISGYEAESPKNDLLEIVISVYKESVHGTVKYARDRIKDTFGDKYSEWTNAYASGVDENRVKMIPDAEFTPNCIKVEVVDLKANHNPKGVILGDVQKTQPGQLAGFAVLYAACQSPEWVRQIDGEQVPWAIAAALLLNVPGDGLWSSSPRVRRNDGNVDLGGNRVGHTYDRTSFPVLRKYKS